MIFTQLIYAINALKTLKGQSINLIKTYPDIPNIEYLLKNNRKVTAKNKDSRALDLGCGINPKNPFNAKKIYGIDIRDDLDKSIKSADLSIDKIPFEDSFFDYVTAFDFLEHIPRSNFYKNKTIYPFLNIMNEIHRVLKPNGYFLHSTPAFPSKEAFMDPTHVNIITEDTFPNYFCRPKLWAKEFGYGFQGDFKLINQGWIKYAWVVSVIQAIK